MYFQKIAQQSFDDELEKVADPKLKTLLNRAARRSKISFKKHLNRDLFSSRNDEDDSRHQKAMDRMLGKIRRFNVLKGQFK